MPETKSLHNLIAAVERLRLKHLLMAAALIHLLTVITLNVIGHFGLLPYTFDQSGIGISFAVDSTEFHRSIIELNKLLERDGLIAWIKNGTTFHVKLYSISYALLGRWLGYSTLAAEPLNLVYYLLILVLVFLLGREVFDRRVGLLAAALVAVWPSLLLHTTQLLRDPLFIASILALLLVCIIFLKRKCSWRKAVALAIGGGLTATISWLVRSQMWEVTVAIVLFTLALLLLQYFWKRSFDFSTFAGCCLLFLIVLSLPQLGRRLNLYSYPPNARIVRQQNDGSREIVNTRQLTPGSSLIERISFLRSGFVTSYPGAGSNIDTDVQFKSVSDIALYLPRAAEIGFFAPFPNMWFVNGPQVGVVGRLWSGVETLLMYGMEFLAALCLWRSRRCLSAWLLFTTASAAMIALGLVVANIATLYRMRYAFWILLIILGIKGALLLLQLPPSGIAPRGKGLR